MGMRTVKLLLAVAVVAAGGFSQTIDSAKVPVISNVAATVSMQPPAGAEGVGKIRTIRAGGSGSRVDTVHLVLNRRPEITSISHGQQRQRAPAAVSYHRGTVSLTLRPEFYGGAAVSLFSVDGRRILRGNAGAADGVFNISRQNVPAGIYLLSVKGANNNTFSARLTHGGGGLTISAIVDDAGISHTPLRRSAEAAADGEWTATVTSPGYFDTSYTFTPVRGRNSPAHNITLRPRPRGGGLGIGPVGCSREGLENAANYLIAAMRAGDHAIMPLTPSARYIENDHSAPMNGNRTVAFGQGLWATPINPDYYMTFIDVDSCATFSELIFVTDNPQYINGVRVKVSGNQISEVFAVVTQTGDWLFDAVNYVRYSAAEDWTELPPSLRLPRKELLDGAEAYFAYFNTSTRPTANPPWGNPCARLEGGAYVNFAMSGASSPCASGVPDLTMNIRTIWHLADVNHGMVVLYVFFGGPDTHMFRILPNNGLGTGANRGNGYRYIHTLTAMRQSDYQP